MATTTPNYGWTVPTSTDLVKDGATAIETLGDAIDASMNTALGTKKAGMVLLNTTSFSAVASQSVNNVFTSSYKNYRVYINAKHASDNDLNFRLRASGTDLSSASAYYQGRYYIGGTSSLAAGSENAVTQTQWTLNRVGTWASQCVMDIANPQATEVTTSLTFVTGGYFQVLGQSLNNNTTSYDGFTIISGGSMTGSVSVYGYNA
jgi:hypothetical protein